MITGSYCRRRRRFTIFEPNDMPGAFTISFYTGLGYAMVIVSALIGLYYDVVIAWCLYYFFASWTTYLPWQDCDNTWNTCECQDGKQNFTLVDPWQGRRNECCKIITKCNWGKDKRIMLGIAKNNWEQYFVCFHISIRIYMTFSVSVLVVYMFSCEQAFPFIQTFWQ